MTHVSCHFFVLKFGATLVYTFCYSTYLLTRSSVHSLCLPTALNVTLVKPELIPEFAGPSIACAEFSGPLRSLSTLEHSLTSMYLIVFQVLCVYT